MTGSSTSGRERPVKIAIVGPLPPPSGGMANQTRQLARLLEESGFIVDIVQTNAPYSPAWIGRVWGLRALFRLPPYVYRLWRAAGQVDLFHVMANSGWAWHLWAAPAVWIAAARARPTIVNYRGGNADAFLSRQRRWVLPTLARASTLAVPSEFLHAVFRRHGVDAEIVPNIVDLALFYPVGRQSRGPHLVVTRNLEEIYDIPTAVRAFQRIRARHFEAKLTIAGSGPCRGALEGLCRDLGLSTSVTFTGRLDNAQVAELYRAADLLLNASRVDNMPVSLLEAMASGVPIVTTNVGGIPYLVEDGRTALLVPSADPVAMADAALRVLGNPELAERLRAAGLVAAQQYTWARVRSQLLAIYSRALTGRVPVHGAP